MATFKQTVSALRSSAASIQAVKEQAILDEGGVIAEVSTETAQKALDARLEKGIHSPRERFNAFRSKSRTLGGKSPPIPKLADREPGAFDYMKNPRNVIEAAEDTVEKYRAVLSGLTSEKGKIHAAARAAGKNDMDAGREADAWYGPKYKNLVSSMPKAHNIHAAEVQNMRSNSSRSTNEEKLDEAGEFIPGVGWITTAEKGKKTAKNSYVVKPKMKMPDPDGSEFIPGVGYISGKGSVPKKSKVTKKSINKEGTEMTNVFQKYLDEAKKKKQTPEHSQEEIEKAKKGSYYKQGEKNEGPESDEQIVKERPSRKEVKETWDATPKKLVGAPPPGTIAADRAAGKYKNLAAKYPPTAPTVAGADTTTVTTGQASWQKTAAHKVTARDPAGVVTHLSDVALKKTIAATPTDTVTKDASGKTKSWSHDSGWRKASKKDPRGTVTHDSDVARRKTEKEGK